MQFYAQEPNSAQPIARIILEDFFFCPFDVHFQNIDLRYVEFL